MGKQALVVLGLLASLAGCKKPAPTVTPEDSGSAPARSSASVSEAVKDNKPALVDLIYATDTVVAVSSRVANPKDFPEHLIDRKKATAWNSKTGDLVGAWIGVRVPKAAHVARFELTVGYDATGRDGTDLFLANHRIKRVRVTKDGKSLGEHELSPDVRKAQAIPVGQDEGGDYKIEILETVPGTKKTWRELAVSELYVLGTPGAGAPPSKKKTPKVYVGSFDPPRPSYKTYRERIARAFFPTTDAFCAEHKAAFSPLIPQLQKSNDESYPWEYKITAECTVAPQTVLTSAPPFLELARVAFEDGGATDITMLLKTAKGWRLATGIWIESNNHFDPGCPMYMRDSKLVTVAPAAGTTRPTLLVHVETEYLMAKLREVHTCALRADEGLDCTPPKLVNHVERQQCNGEPPSCKFMAWGPDDKFTIAPDSTIKLLSPRKMPYLSMGWSKPEESP